MALIQHGQRENLSIGNRKVEIGRREEPYILSYSEVDFKLAALV